MLPLVKDTEAVRPVLPLMLASYGKELNISSWRWGSTDFFKKAIAANPQIKDEIIAGMAGSLKQLAIPDGFEQPIAVNKIFEAARYVDMQKNPQNAMPFLPSIERVYPHLEILPARWTVTGAKWGDIGLAKAAELLGEEGRPFIESLKRIRPDLASRPTKVHQGEELTIALKRLVEVVEAYEKKFGEVKSK